MPHPRDGDHFFLACLSAGEGAWILRGAEGREATGTTRAGVEADRPAPPLEWAIFCALGGRSALFWTEALLVWKLPHMAQFADQRRGISSESRLNV